MTKLNRVTGKVFGGDATATGDNPEIGQFGSALAGTYNGTTDVATIQSLSAWGQGWAGAVTPNTNFPALPEMTGFGKVLSYQQNYILQSGMPEWDSNTIYYTNNFCRVGNVFYYSLTDDNQANDPTTDSTNWQLFIQPANYADVNLSNLSSDLSVGADEKPIYIKNGAITASVGYVGSATTPTYLNSGTITASTYSIENSRFDGQWVAKRQSLSTSIAIGTYTLDLSEYLPEDDYNYEVYLQVFGSNGSSGTTARLNMATSMFTSFACIAVKASPETSTHTYFAANWFTLPIEASSRQITAQITTTKFASCSIVASAYRRIGTNN